MIDLIYFPLFIFQAEKVFIEKYNCILPWMNNNTNFYLCPIIDENRKMTSPELGEKLIDYVDLVYEWENLYHGFEKNCTLLPCKRSIYKLAIKETSEEVDQNYLAIELDSPLVQKVIDSYSYDLQSFVGEVGGTLGLFLGLSVFSFIEFFEFVVRKIITRTIVKG